MASARCMQVEKAPRSGACERCRRRKPARLPADFCFKARRKVRLRTRCAAGSSKPDEIHCCILPRMFFANQSFQIPTPLDNFTGGGKNADEPKGIDALERQMRQSGMPPRSAVLAAQAALTTSPRLTVSPFTRAAMEYQLISANVDAAVIERNPGSAAGFGRSKAQCDR